jgi:uncharacterized protein YjbJ (UPF0337 family)
MEVFLIDWNRVEGNWKQVKGKVKEKWGQLTDDDLDMINGRRDQLEGKIQERYGLAKDQCARTSTIGTPRSRGENEPNRPGHLPTRPFVATKCRAACARVYLWPICSQALPEDDQQWSDSPRLARGRSVRVAESVITPAGGQFHPNVRMGLRGARPMSAWWSPLQKTLPWRYWDAVGWSVEART